MDFSVMIMRYQKIFQNDWKYLVSSYSVAGNVTSRHYDRCVYNSAFVFDDEAAPGGRIPDREFLPFL